MLVTVHIGDILSSVQYVSPKRGVCVYACVDEKGIEWTRCALCAAQRPRRTPQKTDTNYAPFSDIQANKTHFNFMLYASDPQGWGVMRDRKSVV